MKKIPLVLLLSLLNLVFVANKSNCRPLARAIAIPADNPTPAARAEIVKAINAFVKQHSVEGSEVDITTLDVRGTWALAGISPRDKQTDDATILLRKQHGTWRALVLGTALYGTGCQYGVPKSLRKKWGL